MNEAAATLTSHPRPGADRGSGPSGRRCTHTLDMKPAAPRQLSGPRRGEANREMLRTRLLDSAEELLAERGYFGISVRDITEHAGTRVAAISDHFGGKDNLLRDVLLRRIRPINADRRALLAAISRSDPRATRLRALIEAFAQPLLVRAADQEPGWRHYFRFIAQLANSGQAVQPVVAHEFNSIAAEFISFLRSLFPTADEAALHDAYLYMLAATLEAFSSNLRLDRLTRGRLHADDITDRYQSLVPFLEGGITRLALQRRHLSQH